MTQFFQEADLQKTSPGICAVFSEVDKVKLSWIIILKVK